MGMVWKGRVSEIVADVMTGKNKARLIATRLFTSSSVGVFHILAPTISNSLLYFVGMRMAYCVGIWCHEVRMGRDVVYRVGRLKFWYYFYMITDYVRRVAPLFGR
jgi:hypothetical protein